ncbi:MAG TPA: hypothetical protein VHB25_08520 [Gemmatimonadaceae bacterium]|nr:hypothetical protein [Gemmatimonadaceae bacterium]
MTLLRTSLQRATVRKLSTLAGIVRGRDAAIRYAVELESEDRTASIGLVDAVLVITTSLDDAAPTVLLTRRITTLDNPAAGQITDDAIATGTGALYFALSPSDTALLPDTAAFEIVVRDTLGRTETLDEGALVVTTASTPPLTTGVVAAVAIIPPLVIGDDRQFALTAQVVDAHGVPVLGRPLIWNSLNTGVATVDGDGLVTATGAGIVTIAVACDGVTGYCTLGIGRYGIGGGRSALLEGSGLGVQTFHGIGTLHGPTSRAIGAGTLAFDGNGVGVATALATTGGGREAFAGSGGTATARTTTAGSGDNGLFVDWVADAVHTPAGLSFTGGAGRLAQDAAGIFQAFGTNVPRITSSYVFDPNTLTYVPAWLLECITRTNSALGSCAFADGTYWGGAAAFTITAAPSCIAGQSAYLHTGNGGIGTNQIRTQSIGTFVSGQTDCRSVILQKPASNASAVSDIGIYDTTASAFVYLVRFTWSTKTFSLLSGTGTAGYIDLGNGYIRVWITATGTAAGTGANGHGRAAYLYPNGQSGSPTTGMIVVHEQFEANAAFPSSPIITTSATVTRSAETASAPFVGVPQVMTAYVRGKQISNSQSNTGLLDVGGYNGSTHESLVLFQTATNLSTDHFAPGAGEVAAGVAKPIDGADFEMRALLNTDGSVTTGLAINGGVEAMSATSAAAALTGTFGAPQITFGKYAATSAGIWALRAIKVARGVQTLAQMRGFA